MKKFYILAAVALVASAACTKVELDESAMPEVKIGYQVANYATQTKAGSASFLDELTAAPFNIAADVVLFNSVAFINADNGNGGQAAPARFFNAATTNQIETVKYHSGTPATWEPLHTYYWPKSSGSSLDFFSWYDLSATDANHVANATYTSSTYTLAWNDRTVALKDNVMYADPVWNQKNNSQTYKYNDVAEGVPTLFHHALAQVRFQFKQQTMSEPDSKVSGKSTFWVVTVKNVTIPDSKLVKTGSLSLTAAQNASWTTPANLIWTPGTAYWSTSDIFVANAVNSTGIVLTASEQNFSLENQMGNGFVTVLPQALADDFLLNFDVTIETKYGDTTGGAAGASTVSTETIKVKDFPAAGAITANGIKLNAMSIGGYWQMNKKYTYVFNIDPKTSTILYDPAVVDWDAEVTATQSIPNA